MNCVSWTGGGGGSSSSSGGVQTVSAGTGIGVSGTTAVVVSNTGILTVTAGEGIAVDISNPQQPIINNTGVRSLSASNGISISDTTGAIAIENTGVLSLTPGNGITIGGTSTVPIVLNSLAAWECEFIIDEFNGDANVSATTTGSGATDIPIPTTGNIIPMTNMKKYQLSITCAIVSNQATAGGSWMGIYLTRVDNTGTEYGPLFPILNIPESTQSTALTTCITMYARPPPVGNTCAGVRVKVVGENLVGTASGTIYQLTYQQVN